MPEISRWSDAALTAARDKAAATIGQETPERAATFDNVDISDPSDELLQIATSQPWTSEQLPFLATWVHENQEPIDQFVKASHRTRCYFPSPTLLDKTNDPVNMILLPGQQAVSAAGEALGVRAMWSLGEGKTEDAWQDLLAAHRIAHLVSQGYLLVEQIVAMQMADQACTQTVTYLHKQSCRPTRPAPFCVICNRFSTSIALRTASTRRSACFTSIWRFRPATALSAIKTRSQVIRTQTRLPRTLAYQLEYCSASGERNVRSMRRRASVDRFHRPPRGS